MLRVMPRINISGSTIIVSLGSHSASKAGIADMTCISFDLSAEVIRRVVASVCLTNNVIETIPPRTLFK